MANDALLTGLGAASLAFVAAFTYRACRAAPGLGQSPRGAIVEAWLNILNGRLHAAANALATIGAKPERT